MTDTDAKPAKPVPRPAPESIPYWEAAKQHRLSLLPNCLSANFSFQDVSGRGKVYSFVTFHRPYHPAFTEEVPYVVALVELDEGPRLLTNILGIAPEEVRCDMPVVVTYDDVDNEHSIPKFRPA
jgi:hypothetical protein